MAQPLMPHATASWLVDNSSLTFQQIAEFCGLHILEVQAIADDTAAVAAPRGLEFPQGVRQAPRMPTSASPRRRRSRATSSSRSG